MTIVTKTGDKGRTKIGGIMVSKSSKLLEAVGEIDELMAVIGIIKDRLPEWEKELDSAWQYLYLISGRLAGFKTEINLGEEVSRMEQDIKDMEEELGEIKEFLRPGVGLEVNFNWLRAVTRRVERRLIGLNRVQLLEPQLLIWFNRLSDYWFTLGRCAGKKS